MDSPSTTSMTTSPSASEVAVSIDCASRWRRSVFITSRSTTTSIVCLNFLSRTMSSSSSRCSPSTLTRVKPSRRSSSRTSLYSPLRSRTTGALTVNSRALVEPQHLLDDLVERLAGDRAPADRAVRPADARVQEAQVVVDLGHRADRRARVARRRLLVDRDGRREPVDRVDVGLLHHLQELPRVGRERLDVPPLPLGVDRVERKRRLAGAGQPRHAHERVPRHADGDVLQVVLARAVDDELFGLAHRGAIVPRRTDVRSGARANGAVRRPAPGFAGCGRRRRRSLEGGPPAAGVVAKAPDGRADRRRSLRSRATRGAPARSARGSGLAAREGRV